MVDLPTASFERLQLVMAEANKNINNQNNNNNAVDMNDEMNETLLEQVDAECQTAVSTVTGCFIMDEEGLVLAAAEAACHALHQQVKETTEEIEMKFADMDADIEEYADMNADMNADIEEFADAGQLSAELLRVRERNELLIKKADDIAYDAEEAASIYCSYRHLMRSIAGDEEMEELVKSYDDDENASHEKEQEFT